MRLALLCGILVAQFSMCGKKPSNPAPAAPEPSGAALLSLWCSESGNPNDVQDLTVHTGQPVRSAFTRTTSPSTTASFFSVRATSNGLRSRTTARMAHSRARPRERSSTFAGIGAVASATKRALPSRRAFPTGARSEIPSAAAPRPPAISRAATSARPTAAT